MAIDQVPSPSALRRAGTRPDRRSAEPMPSAGSKRAFKVIRVANGRVLAEGTDARTTIDVLTRVESIFDVLVYVWETHAKAWRALTPGEQRTMWDFRARVQAAQTPASP